MATVPVSASDLTIALTADRERPVWRAIAACEAGPKTLSASMTPRALVRRRADCDPEPSDATSAAMHVISATQAQTVKFTYGWRGGMPMNRPEDERFCRSYRASA
jgi:hypothetical protein